MKSTPFADDRILLIICYLQLLFHISIYNKCCLYVVRIAHGFANRQAPIYIFDCVPPINYRNTNTQLYSTIDAFSNQIGLMYVEHSICVRVCERDGHLTVDSISIYWNIHCILQCFGLVIRYVNKLPEYLVYCIKQTDKHVRYLGWFR